MNPIIIPNPERKRALVLVDIQEGFLSDENRWIVPNIKKVIQNGDYDLIVEAVFYAEKDSIWDRQVHWTFPSQPTIPEIKQLLNDNVPLITKTTKSVFKGDKDLLAILKNNSIEEVHLVGLDTNDCVFATANEAFDLGFYTYVVEECTASSQSEELRQAALLILRELDMVKKLDEI